MLEAKTKVENLKNLKQGLEEKGRQTHVSERQNLKEADQIIKELTSALQKREEEMKYSMEENRKLMKRN